MFKIGNCFFSTFNCTHWEQLYRVQYLISIRMLMRVIELIWSITLVNIWFNSNLHHNWFWIVGHSSTKFLKWGWSIVFVKQINVELPWLEKISCQDFIFFDNLSVDLCILLFYDNSSLYYERLPPLHTDFI